MRLTQLSCVRQPGLEAVKPHPNLPPPDDELSACIEHALGRSNAKARFADLLGIKGRDEEPLPSLNFVPREQHSRLPSSGG